jgi:hypothetical protein
MATFATLIKPPPDDPNQAQIESLLELTQLSAIDPVRVDYFTHHFTC